MYGCENWAIKKAECWRIDAYELWSWRRFLSPLDCKEIQSVHPKGNQSWIFIGGTDAEAEIHYFGHLMQRTNSLEKTLMLKRLKVGGEGDNRGWDGWMSSLAPNSGSWWWTWRPGVLQSMRSQRVGHGWSTELNWTGSWVWVSVCR